MFPNLSLKLNGSHALVRTSSCFDPSAKKIGEAFALCLSFVVSLGGNIVIGVIVNRTKNMRRPINFFIVNMAMSDLLFSIILLPLNVTKRFLDSWTIGGSLGQTLCKLVVFLPYVSVTVSFQSMVLIAVDRFLAVLFPLRSPFISSKLCLILILATWIIGMITCTPFLFESKVLYDSHRTQTCNVWVNSAFGVYSVSVFSILTFLTLSFITMLYIVMYSRIKSERIPGEHSVDIQRQRVKREQNLLKLSMTIVIAFTFCWLPQNIILLLPYLHKSNLSVSCVFSSFAAAARVLAQFSCAINPCVCLFFSRNYSRGLRNFIRCANHELGGNQFAP